MFTPYRVFLLSFSNICLFKKKSLVDSSLQKTDPSDCVEHPQTVSGL